MTIKRRLRLPWFENFCSHDYNKIFRNELSVERMKRLTNSEACIVQEDYQVYLTWNEMKWDVFGNVTEYNESNKNMCKLKENITDIFLTGFNSHN